MWMLKGHAIVEHSFLKISSFGLELWEKEHLAQPHSDQNLTLFMTSAIATPALQSVVYNGLAHVGGVKLAGLDRISIVRCYHTCQPLGRLTIRVA